MFIWVYTYVGCHSLNELYKGKEKDCSPHYFTDVLHKLSPIMRYLHGGHEDVFDKKIC